MNRIQLLNRLGAEHMLWDFAEPMPSQLGLQKCSAPPCSLIPGGSDLERNSLKEALRYMLMSFPDQKHMEIGPELCFIKISCLLSGSC